LNRWLALSVLLGAAGLTLLGIAVTVPAGEVGPSFRSAPPIVATPPVPIKAPAGRPPAVVRSAPVELSIPAIGVDTRLSSLGLRPDGTVEVPTSYHEAGWYRFGPSPGQAGNAVVLGHIDSVSGRGVFFELRALHRGNLIRVSLADGRRVVFAVRSMATYTKATFPARQIYAGNGPSTLELVTCAGTFDHTTHHYLSNLVVSASLVSIH